MPKQVRMGATITCSFGTAPSSLIVLPRDNIGTNELPAANVMDSVPAVNIQSFGMCCSPVNPEVIAATAAALGVLTPMPCMPATVSPWVPGNSKTMIENMPALHNGCILNCMWRGVISFSQAGQVTVEVT